MAAADLQTSDLTTSQKLSPARWPASLALTFLGGQRGTQLHKSKHHGPLYVQKAFYPEGPECAHIYLLHPPGGVVSGDTLNVSLTLDSAASVLLTTPGATRFYRGRQDEAEADSLSQPFLPPLSELGIKPLSQTVINRMTASSNSFIEWLPQETIIFDGAHADLVTEVRLDSSSVFCGWEITCLGLQASDAPFLSGKVTQSFSIFVEGVPKILDRLQFDANSPYLALRCGMQGKTVYGSLIAGPVTLPLGEEIVAVLRAMLEQRNDENHCVVTLVNDFVFLRYLGDCSDQAKRFFVDAWLIIRPMLSGKNAVRPRIWAT